jgi:energy-coupling factor transporter ATP-binding protein EcfA2
VTDHHKIINLQAENIMRLVAIEITPDGNVVEITGQNEAGKSSLLNSIHWALTGAKSIPSEPIRRGEKKARVKLDIGGYTVTMKMNAQEDGTYTRTLVVETESGFKAPKPHEFLTSLVGELSSDPLAFINLKPAEQFDKLRAFVKDFDFDDWARRRQDIFNKRTDTGRRAKDYAAQAAGVTVPDGEPPALVDETALVAALADAGKFNTEIERKKATRQTLVNRMKFLDGEMTTDDQRIAAFEKQIADLQAQIRLCEQAKENCLTRQMEIKTELDALPTLPEPIDTMLLQGRISEARATNAKRSAHVAAAQRRLEFEAAAKKAKAEVDELAAKLDAMDEEKAKAIEGSKLPVEGMGFGDGYVTLKGFPFNQASQAEKLRASVALAMAANPKLRILLIRDGSALDKRSMQLLADMAKEHDWQIWCETVGREDKPGVIIIEDGMVRGAPKTETASAEA